MTFYRVRTYDVGWVHMNDVRCRTAWSTGWQSIPTSFFQTAVLCNYRDRGGCLSVQNLYYVLETLYFNLFTDLEIFIDYDSVYSWIDNCNCLHF